MRQLRFIRKRFEEHRLKLVMLFGAAVLIDMLVIKLPNNLTIVILTGAWLVITWSKRLKGRLSIIAGLILIVLIPVAIVIDQKLMADKIAIWAYLMLLVGAIQLIVEQVKSGWQVEKKWPNNGQS